MGYIDDINNKRQIADIELEKNNQSSDIQRIQELITLAAEYISRSIDNKSNIVNVDNFPEFPSSIKTPDIELVVNEIKTLKDSFIQKEPEDKITHKLLSDLITAIGHIPKPEPIELKDETIVTNLIDYTDSLNEVISAVKAIEINCAPVIDVKPTEVIVETDFKTLENKLDVLTKAVKAISIIIPENDDSEMLTAIKKVSDAVNNLKFPVPNYVLPYKSSTGAATQVVTNTSGSVPVYQPDVLSDNVHTGNKELRVYSQSHVCVDNSTTTPLGANGIFDGNWQDTLDYSEIIVSIYTDAGSATDGLVVQWSSNGIDVHGDDKFTILAMAGKTFSFPCQNRYVKVKYNNGAFAQGKISLETLLKRFASKGSSHRIKDSIVGDDDAILTKSIITGLRDDGVFGNATLDNENRLVVSSQPYSYGIAEGSIAGHTPLLKFGTRTTITAGTQSTIWEGPTDRYVYLTSAEQLKVSSSSANDTSAGSGVRTMTLYGLDANLLEISEVVSMNGVTAVTTTKSFLRIYRAVATTVGTAGGTNLGNITITNNAGTITLVYIPIGDGQTLMTLSTIPAGKVGYLTQLTASTDSNKGARFSLYTRQLDGGILYPWVIKYRAYLVGGNNTVPLTIPFRIPEKTDIEIRFTTPGSAGTTSGGATYELWYEDI